MSILKVNSNIIANVISQSAKSRKTVDFKEALKHPLCTVTLRIASASEGSEQTRAIKELLQRLVFQMPLFQTYHSTLMLILLIRWQKCDLCIGIQTVFEGFALKLINSVPKNKNEQLVKASENTAGGENRPLFIKSTESQVPADFQFFLTNDASKIRIINKTYSQII